MDLHTAIGQEPTRLRCLWGRDIGRVSNFVQMATSEVANCYEYESVSRRSDLGPIDERDRCSPAVNWRTRAVSHSRRALAR